MIRRSPAELYIKYLVLHTNKYSNAQIKDILDFAQLDYLGNWYVTKLRGQLKPPDPFHPFDRSHGPSSKFLLSTGLSWIFHADQHGRKAFQILERPRVKEFVEAMIAANAPHGAIASAVSRQYRFACVTADIDRYREFFWNIDLLDSTELRALLQLRVDALENHPNPEIQAQFKAVKNAFYRDSRRAAAGLPFSPLSALVAQVGMGMFPSRLDLAKVLENTRHMVAIRTFEAVTNNGKGDSSKAFDFATVMEKLTNTLETIVKPDEDLRKQLSAIAMRTDDNTVPTIHVLSQGHHTVEVSQMETTNELPAEFDDGDGGEGPSGQPG